MKFHLINLFSRKNFPTYALLLFVLSVIISSQTCDNYSFPISSYSNLGNPNNQLNFVFNIGLIFALLILSLYVRYITIKLFENTQLYRISYIIPVLTAIFIGLFPQREYRSLHPLAIYLNFIILAVLTPVNSVSLWRMSRKLFFIIAILTTILINGIFISFILVPFNSKKLGLVETLILLFVYVVSLILGWFAEHKNNLSTA